MTISDPSEQNVEHEDWTSADWLAGCALAFFVGLMLGLAIR